MVKYIIPEIMQTNVCEPEVDYCTLSVEPPCRMTIDELKTELYQSIEDAKNGLYITIEQARQRHLRL